MINAWIFSDRSYYKAIKSTKVKEDDKQKYGPEYAIDSIVQQVYSTSNRNFYSWDDLQYPWIEVELSEVLDISGVEITSQSSVTTGSSELFRNVKIRAGLDASPLTQDEESSSIDQTNNLITTYKEVIMPYS